MLTQRTPEELNSPEYNYFLAYAIDPTEKDEKKIETVMMTKKNTFTQGTPVYRRLKDLYTEAVAIMTNKTLREEEYKAAKRFKMETAKSAVIAIARGRGAIYKSDLRKIADTSGKWLTADEIEKEIGYLTQQGVKIIDDLKTSMDFLTYDKVEKLLKTAGRRDLYDLLSCSVNSTISELQAAMLTLYNSIAGKSDPKSTAVNQLCGEAKNKIFISVPTKKLYDIYLATRDIWTEFGLRRSTGISDMELREYLAYLEKAVTALKPLDITDINEVEVLLGEGLNFFRISVAGGSERGITLDTCQHCNMMYSVSNNPNKCPHCGSALGNKNIEISNADGTTTTFIERCTKSYGLAAIINGNDVVWNILFKGTPKPAHAEKVFGTNSTNQRSLNLRVYENDSEDEIVPIEDCTQMYETCTVNLPPALPIDTPVSIVFDIDVNGVLSIAANIPLSVSLVRIGAK